MQPIQPETFAAVMRLPVSMRTDLLEFVGGCAVDDNLLKSIVESLAEKYSAEAQSLP